MNNHYGLIHGHGMPPSSMIHFPFKMIEHNLYNQENYYFISFFGTTGKRIRSFEISGLPKACCTMVVGKVIGDAIMNEL